MGITLIKVRAEVTVGNTTIKTPYVLSFNVRRARNTVCTCDASLKMSKDELDATSTGELSIKAGVSGNLKKIFTGILRNMSMAPCWDDPGFVVINISGEDVTSTLQGKTYTRRCRGTKSTWTTIESVVRPGLRDGRWQYETGILSISPDIMISENKQGTTNSPLATGPVIGDSSAVEPMNIGFGYNAEYTAEVNT